MTRAARPFADSAALQHLFGGALNKVGHGFLDECSLRHVGNGHGHRAVLIRLNPDASNQLSCATNPLRDALIVPAQPHARRQRLGLTAPLRTLIGLHAQRRLCRQSGSPVLVGDAALGVGYQKRQSLSANGYLEGGRGESDDTAWVRELRQDLGVDERAGLAMVPADHAWLAELSEALRSVRPD